MKVLVLLPLLVLMVIPRVLSQTSTIFTYQTPSGQQQVQQGYLDQGSQQGYTQPDAYQQQSYQQQPVYQQNTATQQQQGYQSQTYLPSIQLSYMPSRLSFLGGLNAGFPMYTPQQYARLNFMFAGDIPDYLNPTDRFDGLM